MVVMLICYALSCVCKAPFWSYALASGVSMMGVVLLDMLYMARSGWRRDE
jgi:hypothetical protein